MSPRPAFARTCTGTGGITASIGRVWIPGFAQLAGWQVRLARRHDERRDSERISAIRIRPLRR